MAEDNSLSCGAEGPHEMKRAISFPLSGLDAFLVRRSPRAGRSAAFLNLEFQEFGS